jgi:glycosyltransferase involved in cell wall biosynthesis
VAKEKPAVVHCRSYIAALIGLKLKKRFSARFLFDMRGFWPEERMEGKIWNPRNPAYRFLFRYFKKKEIEFIREADHIVTLTKAAEEDLRLRKTTPAVVNISVIPCCADEQLFTEENVSADEKNIWRKKLGLEKENMTMVYLGSLGTWYMVNEMLDFFKELLQKYPAANFLLITNDPPDEIYRLCAEKAIDQDKVITVSASRREVPPLLSICTFSIYFIRPTYSKKASSPTKAAEILLMGKPVLINSGIGDSDEQIRSENCGVIVARMIPSAYTEAIEKLPHFLSLPSQHFREAGEKLFSLQRGAEEYHRIYNRLSK